jgi:prophage regulatory protein
MRNGKLVARDDRTPGLEPLLVRLPIVIRMTGLARSTIYKMVAQDKFPAPVHLVGRTIAWRREEIETWTSARPRVSH